MVCFYALEHMLDQIARHGLIDLKIVANGDTHIDDHHTVEDIGITLGQAVAKAVGDKKGIVRYGHAYVPLDEALSRVVIDFSGRPGIVYDVAYTRGAGRLDESGNRVIGTGYGEVWLVGNIRVAAACQYLVPTYLALGVRGS